MNKIIKNTLILTAITLISGLLLGMVYEITKDPIAASREKARQEAYKAVLKEADSFADYADFDEKEAAKAVKDISGCTVNGVAEAKDKSGETIGYVVTRHPVKDMVEIFRFRSESEMTELWKAWKF